MLLKFESFLFLLYTSQPKINSAVLCQDGRTNLLPSWGLLALCGIKMFVKQWENTNDYKVQMVSYKQLIYLHSLQTANQQQWCKSPNSRGEESLEELTPSRSFVDVSHLHAKPSYCPRGMIMATLSPSEKKGGGLPLSLCHFMCCQRGNKQALCFSSAAALKPRDCPCL